VDIHPQSIAAEHLAFDQTAVDENEELEATDWRDSALANFSNLAGFQKPAHDAQCRGIGHQHLPVSPIDDSVRNVALEVFAGSANEHEPPMSVNTRNQRAVTAVVATGQRVPAGIGLPLPNRFDVWRQKETVDLLTTQHGVVGRARSTRIRTLGEVMVRSIERRGCVLDNEYLPARCASDISGFDLHGVTSERTGEPTPDLASSFQKQAGAPSIRTTMAMMCGDPLSLRGAKDESSHYEARW
jgi:hypothetical protein